MDEEKRDENEGKREEKTDENEKDDNGGRNEGKAIKRARLNNNNIIKIDALEVKLHWHSQAVLKLREMHQKMSQEM